MRVILLTHGGAELVIDELSRLEGVELAGVFIETVTTPRRTRWEKLRRSIKYDGVAATAGKFVGSFSSGNDSHGSPDGTREIAVRHGVEVAEVENYHSADSIEKLKAARADLGVIFGTNIIKESVFSIPKMGSINLHQGLAPYYRGGPPVFWELFNGETEVGLTVHFVASKVDTGDIVLQEKLPLVYDASFGSDFDRFIDKYRSNLRETSARLLARAVKAIAAGTAKPTPQDVTLGKRYRLPTKREKDEMRRRLKARLEKGGV